MRSLVLAVACGLAIGMIFKLGGRRGMDRLVLLAVNYVTAFLIALAALGIGGGLAELPDALNNPVLWLGIVQGGIFIFAFFVLALATEWAGMALAVGVMRLSVVIPFLASWIVWGEVPTVAQGIGLVLAGAAFFMLARRGAPDPAPHRSPGRVLAVLTLLFLSGGAADVGMKIFEEVFADRFDQRLFLTLVFASAALCGVVATVVRMVRGRARVGAAVLGWGVVLGVVNYGSAEFFLRAIGELSGTVVFPLNNIALVMGSALLGVWIWKEPLSVRNWIGLALAGAALLLITA